MRNMEALRLPIGTLVRRKPSLDESDEGSERVMYVVTRVARAEPAPRESDIMIYAGGHIFKAWEIERVRLR